MSRTKTAFKDGHFFVYAADGGVWYQDASGKNLFEANWGAQWANKVAYSHSGQNYVLLYNPQTGDLKAYHCKPGGGDNTHSGKTDAGGTALKVAYCGDEGYAMLEKAGTVHVIKLTDKPQVVASGSGAAMEVLSAYLNQGGGSSTSSQSSTSSSTGGKAKGGRRGAAVGFPDGTIFSYTGENKVTYKTKEKVFWEAQWDKDFTVLEPFIFETGTFVLAYKPTDDTVVMYSLQQGGAKEAFRTNWPGTWTSFSSKTHQGTYYLVATKSGKSEIAAISEGAIKLVYSTSGEDADKVFEAFSSTLVIGEKVITLSFEDGHYFTYTFSSHVTYCSPEGKKLWEANWADQGYGTYMGYEIDGQNYLLTTVGDKGVAMHHLTAKGATQTFKGDFEFEFVSFCLSSFGDHKYLIAGKADGHCILQLLGAGYKIVWTTKLMEANLAFEEYVKTLIGDDASISFSKSASAYASLETLRYPNGYCFAYSPEDPAGDVTYADPAQVRLWKVKWDEGYSHHVGYVFFGKNYLISYKASTGESDIRLLSGTEAVKTGSGKFDLNWAALRVAYFDDQAYLIAEAPGKQAIYQLSANNQKLLHASTGDSSKAPSAEAIIKAAVAEKHILRLPNGFILDFHDGKLSCTGPQGDLFDVPWETSNVNLGFVHKGKPMLFSLKPNSPHFTLSEITNSGPKEKSKGDLDKAYKNFSPVYHNGVPGLIADGADGNSSLLTFSSDAAKPVSFHALGATAHPDILFRKYVEPKTKEYAFITDLNVLPAGKDAPSPVTHICFPHDLTLSVSPDKAVSYAKGNEKPKWSGNWDQDTTHGVGFVFADKNYALTYKHGQGKVKIEELSDSGAKATGTGDIDPHWTSLDVVHHKGKPYLVATKADDRKIYALLPNGISLIDLKFDVHDNETVDLALGALADAGKLVSAADKEHAAAKAKADKASADKAAADKAAADKAAADKAAADKKAADDAAAKKAAADKAAADKAAADKKAADDKAAADKAAADAKAAADKAAADKAAADKKAADDAAAKKAAADKAAADKAAADKAAADKAAAAAKASAKPAEAHDASHAPAGAAAPSGSGSASGSGAPALKSTAGTHFAAANAAFHSYSNSCCAAESTTIVYPNNSFASVFCEGKVSFNTCHWTADFGHAFSHLLGFSIKGVAFLFAYSSGNSSYTITELTTSGAKETHRGSFDAKWESFHIKEVNGHTILVSVNADRKDIGVLSANGYKLLESSATLSDKVKDLIKGL